MQGLVTFGWTDLVFDPCRGWAWARSFAKKGEWQPGDTRSLSWLQRYPSTRLYGWTYARLQVAASANGMCSQSGGWSVPVLIAGTDPPIRYPPAAALKTNINLPCAVYSGGGLPSQRTAHRRPGCSVRRSLLRDFIAAFIVIDDRGPAGTP